MKLLPLLLLCLACLPANAPAQAYEQEIISWRKARLERLVGEDGWVTLAGLFWLTEGENSFGKAPQNKLIANYADLPDQIGVFIVRNGTVTFKAHPGTTVYCQQQPVDSLSMISDQEEHPTVIRYQSFSWLLIKRGERFGIRMKWSEHPNRKALKAIPAYPVSEAWRIQARFFPYATPRKVWVPSVIGIDSPEECPGEIRLQIGQRQITFYPTGSRDSLSLIFGDASNGRDTYSGGRFLPLDKPDENNGLLIDFNLAYNPPCVFTPFATCPMPTQENIIDLAIEAGEKMVDLFAH